MRITSRRRRLIMNVAPRWGQGKRNPTFARFPAFRSANYNCSVVNFSQGSTTGWHTHNCDQVLVVTSGSGKVATEHEQREINVGDVVHIKAGERHWHGATADTTMGHITITLVGSQATHG